MSLDRITTPDFTWTQNVGFAFTTKAFFKRPDASVENRTVHISDPDFFKAAFNYCKYFITDHRKDLLIPRQQKQLALGLAAIAAIDLLIVSIPPVKETIMTKAEQVTEHLIKKI